MVSSKNLKKYECAQNDKKLKVKEQALIRCVSYKLITSFNKEGLRQKKRSLKNRTTTPESCN